MGPTSGQALGRAWGRLDPVGPPAGVLLALSLFPRENNSRKFLADSEKLPLNNFSETKRQHGGTGTGHLVNRLVP